MQDMESCWTDREYCKIGITDCLVTNFLHPHTISAPIRRAQRRNGIRILHGDEAQGGKPRGMRNTKGHIEHQLSIVNQMCADVLSLRVA